MTNPEFWDACARMDWQFENSDSHEVWRRGNAAMQNLVVEIKGDRAKQNIFDDFHTYNFSGEAYRLPKAPKPVRPAEVSEIAVDNLVATLKGESNV